MFLPIQDYCIYCQTILPKQYFQNFCKSKLIWTIIWRQEVLTDVMFQMYIIADSQTLKNFFWQNYLILTWVVCTMETHTENELQRWIYFIIIIKPFITNQLVCQPTCIRWHNLSLLFSLSIYKLSLIRLSLIFWDLLWVATLEKEKVTFSSIVSKAHIFYWPLMNKLIH